MSESAASRRLEPLSATPSGRRQLHLTGFMGSGKSTVGTLLARELLWNFLDLDAVVARHADRTVSEMFAEMGESEFRRLESEALRQVALKPRTVVALGGGTLIDPSNRETCAAAADVVWLDCPLDEIESRRQDIAEGRPLWSDREALEARLAERLPGYQTAAVRVDATAAPDDVAASILAELAIRRD